jgi:predicted unusual protein kinase regulating ubiquinone biosynthesis (AarF/ABC1/UbiB family)
MPLTRGRGRDSDDHATAEGGAADAVPEDPRATAAAQALLASLGELKGFALKVGQMLSYMDGVLPPESEAATRRALGKLQSQAPALSWETAQGVLSAELGEISAHFARIEPAPFAAASIGQVHHATLHNGTEVAVKIQYPGIRESIEADMNNLGMMQGLARPLLAVMGASQNSAFVGEIVSELRDRLREEVDYRREAAMQSQMRDLLADLPGVAIPRVFGAHSADRVLTTEFLPGARLDDVALTADQALRDRWAQALVGAVTQQIWVHGKFNADPHPGNYLFRDDGTVVLLDFGCVKEFTPERRAGLSSYIRAAIVATRTGRASDWQVFDRAIDEVLRFDTADPEVRAMMREMLLAWLAPLLTDAPFTFTREYVAGINELMMRRKRELLARDKRWLPKVPKMATTPGDFVFLNRLQWGFYSVLCRLDATVNWHAMLPPSLRGLEA